MRRWLILMGAVEVLVMGGLAARHWAGRSASVGRPDVVLITIDALRADHLGVYGYDRPTSPNLDALAAESVVVRDHIAQAPFTKASMASLFTGLFPTSHKAYTISRTFSETMTGSVNGTLPFTDVLDASLWHLAAAFQSAGYQTTGLATNPFLLREFGFGTGFADYEFLTEGDGFASADQVLERATAVIDKRVPGRPLFLWVHLMEPHSPYTPPPQFSKLFPPRTPARTVPLDVIPNWIVQHGSTDANLYESLYDGEIRSADAALGTFFAGLRARGAWNHLALVVTADHGEEFFDHGGFEHNRTLYDEMVRVPLIVKAPGLGPGVRDIQTQAVDVAPTLAHLAGVDPPDGLEGIDIWRDLQGKGEGEPVAYAELPGKLYMLRTREWKLISNLEAHYELYHLTADPREQHNRAPFEPDRVERMRNQLAAILAKAYDVGARVHGQFAPISPRVLNRLRSLGYIH